MNIVGGDNFNKTDNLNPPMEMSRGNTILSRLNNGWELAKIRHDAAQEYFDELCEMVEFEINTHHNNRNYFMFIEIEFPVNLNNFVPRPRSSDIDFLMQGTWSDKFQNFLRKQEINCLECDSLSNGIPLKGTVNPTKLKYKDIQLESDLLNFRIKPGIHHRRPIQSTNGNYINNEKRTLYDLRTSKISGKTSIIVERNCVLTIERLPDNYFIGLTEIEIESLNKQRRNYKNYRWFLLTWPKHVFVENKGTKNDFDINGERWR